MIRIQIRRIGTLFVLTIFFSGVVLANSPLDLSPTAEEQLQSRGIDTSSGSLISLATGEAIDSDVRYLAAVSLGRSDNPAHLATLEGLLLDDNADVRIGALIGLRTLASNSSVDSLVHTIKTDPDSTVRRVAITALEAVGTESALVAILYAAETKSNPSELRSEALNALERQIKLNRINYGAVEGPLKQMVNDDSTHIRLAAALAIGAARDKDSVPVLIDIATEPGIDAWSASKAMRSIQRQTALDFGYFENSIGTVKKSRLDREQALERLKSWWAENKSNYELAPNK